MWSYLVDFGNGTLGSSTYFLYFLLRFDHYAKRREMKHCYENNYPTYLALERETEDLPTLTLAVNRTQVTFDPLFPRQRSETNQASKPRSTVVGNLFVKCVKVNRFSDRSYIHCNIISSPQGEFMCFETARE